MAKLVILDFNNEEVAVVSVSKKQQRKLEDKYDNNTEAWFAEEGFEEKLQINLNCAQYMWVENDVKLRNYEV